jgi:hypothetical protein
VAGATQHPGHWAMSKLLFLVAAIGTMERRSRGEEVWVGLNRCRGDDGATGSELTCMG